ncbi:C45 family autoproteolytic acyltransferase/hydrolase [Halobacillus sp. ACCC02827]|uniref:C45 family autoproteolytic acyltransferase/hydolase n=1 Tax=Halobacillus sp. ACCC02827 TaxID=3052090 RepID=UPI00256FB46A|nr:C45 family peptidase [Halobacillus sp. ACCC02827]WJE14015.1 C45 family autoproteolytic acyltransferase/hydrolase [Halobacillus sp. ACCC02827]
MKDIYTDVFAFRGGYGDFGYEQGRGLQSSRLLNYHKNRRPRSVRHYKSEKSVVKHLLDEFFPPLWEELLGLAEGLKWSVDDVVHEYSGWQQEWDKSGCSILTGDSFFTRNYDYHPKTYEGRFLIYAPTKGTPTIGPGQRILGRTDGMNAYGLCIGYNFVNRVHPGDGFICCTLTRIILETCRTTEEAVDMLKRLPHRHSFNYVVTDCNGVTKTIEGSPRGVRIHEALVCTNHFLHLENENRRHLSDSHERLGHLMDAQKRMNGEEAFRFLNDTTGPIFSKRYSQWSGTIHTCSYQPRDKIVRFGLGGDTSGVSFDFGEFMNGKRIRVKKVLGHLDTQEPIPYNDDFPLE